MHPVQAAPRQRAIVSPPFAPVTDAPRAGSAKQNNNVPPDGPLTTGRHFFTFHPSRIPTVEACSFVTMYYFHPCLLAKSPIAKQNCSHRANVVCDGSPSRIRRVRRISLGMTILPRSSIRRTIPVAFISFSSTLCVLNITLLLSAKNGDLCEFRRWKKMQVRPMERSTISCHVP